MYVGSFGWYGYCYSQSQRVAPLGLAGGSGLARRAGFGMRRVPPAAAHQSHRPPQKVNTSRILAVVAASTSTRISGPTAPRAPRLGIRGRKIGRRSHTHTHHATRRGVHARSPARTAYIHRTYDSSPDRPGSVTGPVASSRRARAVRMRIPKPYTCSPVGQEGVLLPPSAHSCTYCTVYAYGRRGAQGCFSLEILQRTVHLQAYKKKKR